MNQLPRPVFSAHFTHTRSRTMGRGRGAARTSESLAQTEAPRSAVAAAIGLQSPHIPLLRELEARARSAGENVPALPPLGSAGAGHGQRAVRDYAVWLNQYMSQSGIADVLNALGVRTRIGARWTRPAVRYLLRDEERHLSSLATGA